MILLILLLFQRTFVYTSVVPAHGRNTGGTSKTPARGDRGGGVDQSMSG